MHLFLGTVTLEVLVSRRGPLPSGDTIRVTVNINNACHLGIWVDQKAKSHASRSN